MQVNSNLLYNIALVTVLTEFVLDELGEQRQMDRQQMVAMSHTGCGKSPRSQSRDTYKEEDKTPITSGLLRDFEPGECIVISRTTWWHGRSYELHKVRDSLPENGAESSATPRVKGSDNDDLEEYDSWLSLARSKVPIGQSDDDDKGDAASTDDRGDETADETELDSDVWTADTDSTPDISFLDHRWEQALTRLDVQGQPITDKESIDAINDIAAMLDDRVRMVPETTQETEARTLLADIVAHTGLSKVQTLDVVTDRTELLRVNEAFKESFVDGETAGTSEPFAQDTDDTTDTTSTPASTPTEGADDDSEVEATEAESDSVTDDGTNTEPDSQVDDKQYTLDGIENTLPDDSPNEDDTTDHSQSDSPTESADTNDTTEKSTDDATTSGKDDDYEEDGANRNAHEFM